MRPREAKQRMETTTNITDDAVVFGNLARRAEESIGRRLDKDRARTGLRGGEVRAA